MEHKTIVIAADHAGFELKEFLRTSLKDAAKSIQDLGTDSLESVDYSILAYRLAGFIERGDAEMGILICGSGIGISIAANRSLSVRAALCRDIEDATMARSHNDANVLALSGRSTNREKALSIARVFFDTSFEGGRHLRRVAQLS